MKNKLFKRILFIFSLIILILIFAYAPNKKVSDFYNISNEKEDGEELSEQKDSSTTSSNEEVAISTEVSKDKEREEELKSYLNQLNQDNIFIYIKNLSNQHEFGLNENKSIYGASIAKLPIISYTLSKIQDGEIHFSDKYSYTKKINDIPGAMLSTGTGSIQNEAYQGKEYSIESLLEKAIVESDNQASNMLSYYIGDKNGVDFLNYIAHFSDKNLNEFTKDINAKTAGKLIEDIYNTHLVDKWFLNTLWQKEKIGSLPYKVFHKIGINEPYNHDAGVVISSNPYVMVILTKGLSNDQIADIAKNIQKYME